MMRYFKKRINHTGSDQRLVDLRHHLCEGLVANKVAKSQEELIFHIFWTFMGGTELTARILFFPSLWNLMISRKMKSLCGKCGLAHAGFFLLTLRS